MSGIRVFNIILLMKDEDTRKLGDLCNLFVEYREEVKKQEIQNFDYFLHGKTQFQDKHS